MSNIITTSDRTIKAKNPIAFTFSSFSLVSGFFNIFLKINVKNHLPPSRAGMGKVFIQANVKEIIAAKNKTVTSPDCAACGKITPIIPIGPDTPAPAAFNSADPSLLVSEEVLIC